MSMGIKRWKLGEWKGVRAVGREEGRGGGGYSTETVFVVAKEPPSL